MLVSLAQFARVSPLSVCMFHPASRGTGFALCISFLLRVAATVIDGHTSSQQRLLCHYEACYLVSRATRAFQHWRHDLWPASCHHPSRTHRLYGTTHTAASCLCAYALPKFLIARSPFRLAHACVRVRACLLPTCFALRINVTC